MKEKPWYVYIIQSENGFLYTGITTDIERRFQEHLGSKKGAKYFRTVSPKKIVYRKTCLNRSEASKLESKIKKMSRKEKLALVGRKRKNLQQ